MIGVAPLPHHHLMEKWEYGYLYVVQTYGTATTYGPTVAIASIRSKGTYLVPMETTLDALDTLGAEGWIVSDKPSQLASAGGYPDWMEELVQQVPGVGRSRGGGPISSYWSYMLRRRSG